MTGDPKEAWRDPLTLERAWLLPAHRLVLEALARSPLGARYHLCGGAALSAFYLHHQLSRDLDLFTEGPVDAAEARAFIEGLPGVELKRYLLQDGRRRFFVELNGHCLDVEFTHYPYPSVVPPHPVGGTLRVASLSELFVNKLAVIAGRAEPRDDVDLYFLLEAWPDCDLGELVRRAEAKFGEPVRDALIARLGSVPADLECTGADVERPLVVAAFHEAAVQLLAG